MWVRTSMAMKSRNGHGIDVAQAAPALPSRMPWRCGGDVGLDAERLDAP